MKYISPFFTVSWWILHLWNFNCCPLICWSRCCWSQVPGLKSAFRDQKMTQVDRLSSLFRLGDPVVLSFWLLRYWHGILQTVRTVRRNSDQVCLVTWLLTAYFGKTLQYQQQMYLLDYSFNLLQIGFLRDSSQFFSVFFSQKGFFLIQYSRNKSLNRPNLHIEAVNRKPIWPFLDQGRKS